MSEAERSYIKREELLSTGRAEEKKRGGEGYLKQVKR